MNNYHDSRPAEEKRTLSCGVLIDCSRNAVITPAALRLFLSLCAEMGYSFVGLYLEDTIRIPGEPYFGYMRGALTIEEIREADRFARSLGLELRPYIQTLAHLNQIRDYACYEQIIDTDDILLAGDPGTECLLDRLLRTVSEAFTSRVVNIGMDEAHMAGLGKYLDRHGYEDRTGILRRHLDTVLSLCRKYGLKPQMWGDMFFRLRYHGEYYVSEDRETGEEGRILPEEMRVPDGLTLSYWDYYSLDKAHYSGMLSLHRQLSERVSFTGGAWRWMGFAPYNRYSIRASYAALQACYEQEVDTFTLAMWGDDGSECSIFALLPTLFLVADRIAAPDLQHSDRKTPGDNATEPLYTPEQSERFRRMTGYTLEEFFLLDEVNPGAGREDARNNLSKILLYNDPLLGIFDKTAGSLPAGIFHETAAKLRAVLEHCPPGEFPHNPDGGLRDVLTGIFRTQETLCEVLESKADLGVRLRSAYRRDSRDALVDMAHREIPELIRRIDRFYGMFREQWYREAKPFGFEVQTIRIGGLKQRLADVRILLEEYLRAERAVIEELEEDVLPPGYVLDDPDPKRIEFNRYEKTATASRLSW